jgi:hypothetical protein
MAFWVLVCLNNTVFDLMVVDLGLSEQMLSPPFGFFQLVIIEQIPPLGFGLLVPCIWSAGFCFNRSLSFLLTGINFTLGENSFWELTSGVFSCILPLLVVL